MNYFNVLEKDFAIKSLENKMLLKSNFVDFNNSTQNNFIKNIHTNTDTNTHTNTHTKTHTNKNRNNIEIQNFFYPREKDTLFWCYYISKYGLNEYLINKKKTFSLEHDYKIRIVEKIQQMKDKLKMYKIKKTLVEDELVNSNKIGISTLMLFMLLDNKNLIIIKKNSYFKIIYDTDNIDINIKNYFIIFSNIDGSYYLNNSITNTELNNIISKSYELENFDKPLKSPSSYKLHEIQGIAKILNINIYATPGKSKTKQFLYNEILEKIL